MAQPYEDSSGKRNGPATAIALAIMVFTVLHAWNFSTKTFGFDFYQFWLVGREIGKPDAKQIYTDAWRQTTGERYWKLSQSPEGTRHQGTAAEKRRVLQTYSSPLLYTFFGAIGSASYARSLAIYQGILFASGMLAIVILGRVLRYSAAAIMLTIAVAFGWVEAYQSDIFCANVNQLQFLGIAILASLEIRPEKKSNDALAGTMMALLVLFKPNLLSVPVLVGLTLLGREQRPRLLRQLGAGLIASLLIILLTSIRLGSADCWVQWIGSLKDLEQASQVPQEDNCSLAAVLMVQAGHAAARIASIVIPLITAGAIAFAARRRHGDRASLLVAIFAGCALPLLASSLAWLHYFVLAMPLLMFILRPREPHENRSHRSIRYLVGTISLIFLCQSQVVTEWLWLDDPASRAARLAGATSAIFALALLELYRGGEYHDPVNLEESIHASSQVR